ncbi:restriction endonuclease [Luteimonas sp. YGD11-2]|uniref:restriction endonuclease n=1 Tax=Luteimonas sp. YGD11-2 TaxID=2508168 RepID=UPI00100A90DC|nr:restriction endonuclease [Luteimonas sp. YGD11-2]
MRYGLKGVSRRRDDVLTRVRWDRLEHLLADWYRDAGYAVEHVGTGATSSAFDGGIDLKLRRGDEYLLVQVKHWNAYKVPHNDVHQLIGLMVNEGASGAILATSGEFTRAAIEAATRHGHVRLIDGDELRTMLGRLPEAGGNAVAGSRGERIAAAVGEHLLHSAMDRLVPGTRRRGSDGIKVTLGLMAAKAVFSLIVLAGAFFLLRSAIESFTTGVTQAAGSPRPSVPSTGSNVPLSPQRAVTVAGPRPTDAAHTGPASNPCHEVIDHFSGTYIDRCAKNAPRRPLSEAEARGARRKADAAIELLRDSTPEM